MNVLITGADGFIGSHLVEECVKEGHHVRAFVYYNSFNSWGWLDTFPKELLSRIEVFAGDIRDPHGVREAMQGIDVVYHLAAHPFQLPFAGFLYRYEYQRHPQYPSSGP
jgi:nucleoside-diphosphate-sugar epimerase